MSNKRRKMESVEKLISERNKTKQNENKPFVSYEWVTGTDIGN